MAYKFVKTTKATTTVTKRSYFCRIQWFPFIYIPFVYKDPCVKGCSWFFHSLVFNPNAQQLSLFFYFFILVLTDLTAFEGGPATYFYFCDNVDSFICILSLLLKIYSKSHFHFFQTFVSSFSSILKTFLLHAPECLDMFRMLSEWAPF